MKNQLKRTLLAIAFLCGGVSISNGMQGSETPEKYYNPCCWMTDKRTYGPVFALGAAAAGLVAFCLWAGSKAAKAHKLSEQDVDPELSEKQARKEFRWTFFKHVAGGCGVFAALAATFYGYRAHSYNKKCLNDPEALNDRVYAAFSLATKSDGRDDLRNKFVRLNIEINKLQRGQTAQEMMEHQPPAGERVDVEPSEPETVRVVEVVRQDDDIVESDGEKGISPQPSVPNQNPVSAENNIDELIKK